MSETMKNCTKCHLSLCLDSFGKDKQKKDGLASRCKKCSKERAAAYRNEFPDKAKASAKASADKTRDLRNMRARDRRRADPDRARSRDKAFYEKNSDQIKQRNRDSYYRNREARLACSARWRAENPEKYCQAQRDYYRKNREEMRKRSRDYYQANKEKFLGYSRARRKVAGPSYIRARAIDSAKRRAAKRLAIPSWFCAQSCKQMYAKAEILTRLTGVRHEVDHIVPILSAIVCGLHWHGNMRVITKSENATKGNRYWPDMP